jgi:dTDP-4-amino-4,6-dideoxygalactose transaminase
MAVPFFRLEVTDAERAAVDEVLRSGWLTTGKACHAFEKEFADFIGGGVEAIAVNSNTSGMHLVLEAAGIGPGDEVIVPALTFTATAEVVRYLGADPVLVDVLATTQCIDPACVEKAITPRTKAIMPVHFGGIAADMTALKVIAKKHSLKIIEDAAHSFPTTSGGKYVGDLGTTAAIFSFYANKTMTTGEGGMIVTSDPEIAKRCRVMRLHGIDRDAFARFTGKSAQWKYDVVAPGFKYNLPDMAAALGREQLKFASGNQVKRQKIADQYYKHLSDLPLQLPAQDEGEMHAWHLFALLPHPSSGKTRSDFEDVFQARGIGYSVHYTPLHRLTYWKERYNLSDDNFPVASAHGDNTISLPIFSAMRDDEVLEVIDAVRSVFARNSKP